MPSIRHRSAAGMLAFAGLGLAVAAGPAVAHRDEQWLVVRGEATVVDGPCDASGCRLELTDGRFRGAPVGAGAYAGAIKLRVTEPFPNGEDGICAPLKARIVLGAGTADRLVLALAGDSCQDGAGPLETGSFTGLARFVVKHGTGRYAHATGSGQAVFAEDAANRHRMTLIGTLAG